MDALDMGVPPKDGLLYVPHSTGGAPVGPVPLLVMLHGATSNARRALDRGLPFADELGFVVLAPDSRGVTWDVIEGGYGPDGAFIDAALAKVFAVLDVDLTRLALGGFSDGASYALSLGITNGDLFSHVLAYSPGFVAPAGRSGHPRVFVSHGTQDPILPIEQCSRRIAPGLHDAGYEVRYIEFEGGHQLPGEVAEEGMKWWLQAEL